MEYNRAIEIGKYIIILFINDSAQITFNQIKQDPSNIKRLSRFRLRLLHKHTVDYFNDEHEAAWKILAALRIYEIKLREEQHDIGGNR